MNSASSYQIGERIFLKGRKIVVKIEDIRVENGVTVVDIQNYDYTSSVDMGSPIGEKTITKDHMEKQLEYHEAEKLNS